MELTWMSVLMAVGGAVAGGLATYWKGGGRILPPSSNPDVEALKQRIRDLEIALFGTSATPASPAKPAAPAVPSIPVDHPLLDMLSQMMDLLKQAKSPPPAA